MVQIHKSPCSTAVSKKDLRTRGSLFNSLPNDKILDWSKLKAFADTNIKVLNPFPNDKFLDSSKLKEFADDNENGRKLSKWLENTEGKGELLVTSNFSFSLCAF